MSRTAQLKTGVTINEEVPSNQEEADIKVILHCHHPLQDNPKWCHRSPLGDTNILILAASFSENSRTYIDYGNGKLRKGFWLNQINTINENLKKPLIRFHALLAMIMFRHSFEKVKRRVGKL